jgi:hypothetical protein
MKNPKSPASSREEIVSIPMTQGLRKLFGMFALTTEKQRHASDRRDSAEMPDCGM